MPSKSKSKVVMWIGSVIGKCYMQCGKVSMVNGLLNAGYRHSCDIHYNMVDYTLPFISLGNNMDFGEG